MPDRAGRSPASRPTADFEAADAYAVACLYGTGGQGGSCAWLASSPRGDSRRRPPAQHRRDCASAARSGCVPTGGNTADRRRRDRPRVLARSSQAALRPENERGLPGGTRLAHDTGVRVHSRGAGAPQFGGSRRAVGLHLGYLEGQFGIDAGCEGLVVADIAARRILTRAPSIGCSVDAGFVRREVVTDLVLGPGGSAAWILERRSYSVAQTLLVYTVARGGSAAVLDQGPDIGATSLTLSSGTLGWWHAGVHRTAPAP